VIASKYKTFSNLPATGFVCPRVHAVLPNRELDCNANRTFAQFRQFVQLKNLGINVLFGGNATGGISTKWLDATKTKP